MFKHLIIATLAIAALTAPAIAQFPPPGIYACVTADNAAFGTLTLLVAGDYDFKSTVIPSGRGQVASAGPSVNALTGPLADIHLTGSFSTNAHGEAVFIFDSDKGRLQCALPTE
ncbi:hypothetical protein WH87_00730 [Devosia epidermidihirudinis]|uniref:C-type lysozyme inhibitor domain-containing protein n=1 Tax=Devosia epidermidihirudinis TaxID=1293439 RepID=A0A0F5QN64_9HYPH|nr:hypothetical protein [Devosia epidermidihirudinis]KKC41499.1 hypothetical protein WH87_00730 [Devosia epidermidihirudinis]